MIFDAASREVLAEQKESAKSAALTQISPAVLRSTTPAQIHQADPQPRIDNRDLSNIPPAIHHARRAPERLEEAKDSEDSDDTGDTEEVLVHAPGQRQVRGLIEA